MSRDFSVPGPGRLAAAGLLASLLLGGLTACGGGGDAAEPAPDESIDGEVATGSLLIPSDLPAGYRSVPGIEAVTLPGCLSAIDDLEAVPAGVAVEAKYVKSGQPDAAILSGVRSYADAEAITEALDTLQEQLEDCPSVDGDGISLTNSSNDRLMTEADAQLNLRIRGTVRTEDRRTTPYQLFFTLSRVDNNLTRVASYRFGRGTPPGNVRRLNEIAVDRLIQQLS